MMKLALKVRPLQSVASLLAIALCLGLLMISLRNFVAGAPSAKLPASSLFHTPDISQWGKAPERVSTEAFALRPLFSESRRPYEPPVQDAPSTESASAPVVRQTLAGWSLLGIFNSGEVEGAIVRQKDGARRRVLVDDIVGDWRLLSVEPRVAVFRSVSSGDEAELTMSLASLEGLIRNVPSPSPIAGSAPSGATGSAPSVATPTVANGNSWAPADSAGAAPNGDSASALKKQQEAPRVRDPRVFGGGQVDG